MKLIVLVISFFLSFLSAAYAQDSTELKTLQTGNDSRGWEAVGRLNIGGHGFCTGALISPDLVLTAAHCLFDRQSGRQYEPEEIEFLAGWRNGRANAHATLSKAIPHPKFEFRGPDRNLRVANDVALLQLSQPIRKSSVIPFETDEKPRKGAKVGIVSYGRGRSESPALQEVCHVLARRSGTLILSCDVDFGSSGAPIFSIDDEGVARIVSVVSAKAEISGRNVSLGTSLEKPLAELRALLDQQPLQNSETPVVRKLKPSGTITSSGARFVRP